MRAPICGQCATNTTHRLRAKREEGLGMPDEHEYFYVANSNAAPFFSDTIISFVKAQTASGACEKVKKDYKHPAGLYALGIYSDATAYHKGEQPILTWLCPLADRRQNGIRCPDCGESSPVSVFNSGGLDADLHRCEKGHETLVRRDGGFGN